MLLLILITINIWLSVMFFTCGKYYNEKQENVHCYVQITVILLMVTYVMR